MNTMWIYQGKALEFVPGVPPRDLTAGEYENLEDWQKELIAATGLYLFAEGEQQ